jgi:hypothetical protein
MLADESELEKKYEDDVCTRELLIDIFKGAAVIDREIKIGSTYKAYSESEK